MNAYRKIAEWMFNSIMESGVLFQDAAVHYIQRTYGAEYIYINDNGGYSIDKKILSELAKIRIENGKPYEWIKREKCWEKISVIKDVNDSLEEGIVMFDDSPAQLLELVSEIPRFDDVDEILKSMPEMPQFDDIDQIFESMPEIPQFDDIEILESIPEIPLDD